MRGERSNVPRWGAGLYGAEKLGKPTANMYISRRFLFNGRFKIMIQRYKKSINYQVFEKIMLCFLRRKQNILYLCSRLDEVR